MAIHIYTGNGKGKTTCAVGLAARCAGHGKKVCFYQFLKCEPSGECAALSELVEFHCVKEKFGFVINMTESQKKEVREKTRALFAEACNKKCDMLVLDEILGAISCEFITEQEVLEYVKNADCEVVLTGRDASDTLIEVADYVTEMKAVKHIYEKGVSARCGIEF